MKTQEGKGWEKDVHANEENEEEDYLVETQGAEGMEGDPEPHSSCMGRTKAYQKGRKLSLDRKMGRSSHGSVNLKSSLEPGRPHSPHERGTAGLSAEAT
ncbi:hypothetical protein CVT25_010458 [Psilocybe cyanescens]|uniref:Uncharacterized protein n=1 Tax=Psilocybe cyanescens TaxID=93625 RepID=A0A409XQ14_PSICY|nr:hypothetical protein CVT25_010458 [Psilocybe cyanescens]